MVAKRRGRLFPITDYVTLLKRDATRFERVPAHVQPTMIFISDASLPIEEGDRFLRNLPNGLIESYLVEDRGFYSAIGSFPDHYQVKVRKESSPPRMTGHAVYNLHGPNSRVNINSVDASANLAQVLDGDLFTQLREALDTIADETIRKRLSGHVDEMERAKGTSGFVARYRDFLAAAADHMTVLQPFIVPLSQLLSG